MKTLASLITESDLKVTPQSWGWQVRSSKGNWLGSFDDGNVLKKYLQDKINEAKSLRS